MDTISNYRELVASIQYQAVKDYVDASPKE